ncbi:ATP-dependent zinc protease [Halomonas sp. EGI 63088]|uniref:ATP-dependent zinc protease n=1 Tax=Halomonas flagellata TaxID=2920385 RepID=A0ABS9RSM9_9GAMM|nr:ATP-dependent zinc protease [Halomonas flagellata]MCH4562845.1 ATP-dependent zinc protease [Halomonas flagellata]
MRQRLLHTGALSLALLVTGCALPSDRPEPPPVLTPDEFAMRIDRLETDLASRCDVQQERLAEQFHRQDLMHTEVRELGSLLGHLRADIERLEHGDGEPVVMSRECAADELGLANKAVVGRSEWVGLPDVGTYLKARVDSGANTSSLSATEVTRFERDGEDWVRFKLGLGEKDVAVEGVRDDWIEAPIERRVRIHQATGEHSRPVVSLLMTLGPIRETVEFTLNDRSHLNYPVLLGRRFLMDIAVIDVAENYLHERPEFPGGRPAEEADRDETGDRDDEEEA